MRRRQLLILLVVVVLIKLLSDTGEYLALPEIDCLFGNMNTRYLEDEQFLREHDTNNAYTRNLNRIRQIKKFCTEIGFSEVKNTADVRAHISPNNTVLYCRINKCASTMTLELMKQVFDCNTECLIENAKIIKKDSTNAVHIMQRPFSFIVVREPYSRILSTFSNIFYFPKEDWLYRSTKIIKQVRNNPTIDSLTYGHDLTFAELIKYIVENYEKRKNIDEHVRPMSYKSCNPCSFSFDFIVKLETIKSDFEYLLSEWKSREFIDNYDVDIISKLREWTIYGPIKHLFRVIPSIKNSNISLYNLFLRAWSYYQITGQVSKNFLFPFNEQDIDSITATSFRNSLEKAIKISANLNHDLKYQRIEAMREAYSTVPKKYLERLQNVVRTDCLLFGYDQKLSVLNTLTTYNSNSDDVVYFKGLDL